MKPHRIYTLFRNLTFALLPALLALCAGGDGMFYAGGIFLFVAVMALVFPVRQDVLFRFSAHHKQFRSQSVSQQHPLNRHLSLKAEYAHFRHRCDQAEKQAQLLRQLFLPISL